MSSNTRASVKNRANNDPNDEMKRRARRRLVGSLVLFLTALIVVPALIEGEPGADKPEIELVFPSKPGSQEEPANPQVEAKLADKGHSKADGKPETKLDNKTDGRQEEVLLTPADSNPDIIPPPVKAPVEKATAKTLEPSPHASTTAPSAHAGDSHTESTEPKKPSVQDISKAAAAKEAAAKEASRELAAKEAATKEAAAKENAAKEAAKEAAKLAAKAEAAKKEALAKESAAKESVAKPKPAEKSEDAIAKFADADSKPEAHSKEPTAAPANQPSKPTFIQVAALKDQARAEALRDELSAKGFASRVQSLVTDQGTVYRVRIGPFSDAEKADKTKSDLAKQGYNARVAQ